MTMLWTFFGTSFGGQFEKYPLVEIATSVKTDAHTDIIEINYTTLGIFFGTILESILGTIGGQ